MNNSAIGVFDSGVGGLTCVKELAELLPHENIVYLGDTARVPYGTRSRETIMHYAGQDVDFLMQHDVKMILVACGTVSSVLPDLSLPEGVPPVSGVVIPAAAKACQVSRNRKIGVIATSATIKSGSYVNVISQIDPEVRVIGKACPMFVPLVENGYTSPECPPARYFAEEYLQIMKDEGVDTLILGCTHYPHLSEVISQVMGEGVTLISSGGELAGYALRTLTEKNMLADRNEPGRIQLFCTDSATLFTENTRRFLGDDIKAEISRCRLKT